VTKIISLAVVNFFTPKAGAEHELLLNAPASENNGLNLPWLLEKVFEKMTLCNGGCQVNRTLDLRIVG
jgi:hypothetical protein